MDILLHVDPLGPKVAVVDLVRSIIRSTCNKDRGVARRSTWPKGGSGRPSSVHNT